LQITKNPAISFGTDGWRDVISDGFTFDNVRLVAQAIAQYLLGQEKGEVDVPLQCGNFPQYPLRVVVGYDTRFLSDKYAEEIACVLAGNGLSVHLVRSYCTSPMLSLAVRELKAGGGVMVTASHNPPEYNGIKFKGYYGGSALKAMSSKIESIIRRIAQTGEKPKYLDFKKALSQEKITLFDPRAIYIRKVSESLDIDSIRKVRGQVVFDPMFGASSGLTEAFLEHHRITSIRAETIRGERNPCFGGVNPEPIIKNIGALIEKVRSSDAIAGFAFDGDGDRAGAVDENGNFVDSHRLFSLILVHLCRHRGYKGKVAKTFSTTTMVDKIASSFGLEVIETPIGFRHICDLMISGDILMGGEESGGIGIKKHIPERDGVLTSLLILEMMGRTGKGLGSLVQDLLSEFGPHYYGREDVPLDGARVKKILDQLKKYLGELEIDPVMKDGFGRGKRTVTGVLDLDGYKIQFKDSSWILFRPSGTEPVLRIYAEAATPSDVKELLAQGREFTAALSR
jgi:phosphomannomutase